MVKIRAREQLLLPMKLSRQSGRSTNHPVTWQPTITPYRKPLLYPREHPPFEQETEITFPVPCVACNGACEYPRGMWVIRNSPMLTACSYECVERYARTQKENVVPTIKYQLWNRVWGFVNAVELGKPKRGGKTP